MNTYVSKTLPKSMILLTRSECLSREDDSINVEYFNNLSRIDQTLNANDISKFDETFDSEEEDDFFAITNIDEVAVCDTSETQYDGSINPFVAGGNDVFLNLPSFNSVANKSLYRFRMKSPAEIVEELFKEQMILTIRCFNLGIRQRNLTHIKNLDYGELLVFHSIRIFMSFVQLPNEYSYWDPNCRPFNTSFPDISNSMSFRRFKEIKANLRFADYLNDVDSRDAAWKVRKLINQTKKAFYSISPFPSQHLSIDEGMGRCYAMRNPIRIVIPNKPISCGFKFYCLVDVETKICLNFNVEDGSYKGFDRLWSYGISGKHVMNLLERVRSENHIIFTDRYFTSLALARELKLRNFYLVGTLHKDRKPVNDKLKSTSKHPKNFKGLVSCSYVPEEDIFEYGIVDKKVVLMLDTAYGPKNIAKMKRKTKSGTVETFDMPKAIVAYNNYKGGVDTFDQMRSGHHAYDMKGRILKWTVRFHDCLLNMAITNAYNIYRYLHGDQLNRSEFQIQLMNELHKSRYKNSVIQTRQSETQLLKETHTICQYDKGSRNDESNRRKSMKCRHCNSQYSSKGKLKYTKYFCLECKVALHPECFDDYHNSK